MSLNKTINNLLASIYYKHKIKHSDRFVVNVKPISAFKYQPMRIVKLMLVFSVGVEVGWIGLKGYGKRKSKKNKYFCN